MKNDVVMEKLLKGAEERQYIPNSSIVMTIELINSVKRFPAQYAVILQPITRKLYFRFFSFSNIVSPTKLIVWKQRAY